MKIPSTRRYFTVWRPCSFTPIHSLHNCTTTSWGTANKEIIRKWNPGSDLARLGRKGSDSEQEVIWKWAGNQREVGRKWSESGSIGSNLEVDRKWSKMVRKRQNNLWKVEQMVAPAARQLVQSPLTWAGETAYSQTRWRYYKRQSRLSRMSVSQYFCEESAGTKPILCRCSKNFSKLLHVYI